MNYINPKRLTKSWTIALIFIGALVCLPAQLQATGCIKDYEDTIAYLGGSHCLKQVKEVCCCGAAAWCATCALHLYNPIISPIAAYCSYLSLDDLLKANDENKVIEKTIEETTEVKSILMICENYQNGMTSNLVSLFTKKVFDRMVVLSLIPQIDISNTELFQRLKDYVVQRVAIRNARRDYCQNNKITYLDTIIYDLAVLVPWEWRLEVISKYTSSLQSVGSD